MNFALVGFLNKEIVLYFYKRFEGVTNLEFTKTHDQLNEYNKILIYEYSVFSDFFVCIEYDLFSVFTLFSAEHFLR